MIKTEQTVLCCATDYRLVISKANHKIELAPF